MSIDILINQIDEHNEGSILLCHKVNPYKVYYIANKEDEDKVKSIKEYYSKNFKDIELNILNIEEGDSIKLYDFIESLANKDILVNITGGKRINSLILLNICIQKRKKAIYLDIKNKKIYQFIDKVKIINEEFDDLEIKDIIKAAGGEVLEDSLNLCYKEDLIYFSQQIYNNLSLWHKYKQKLYDTGIFKHDISDSNKVYINISLLNEEERKLIDVILNKLKKMNELDYLLKDNKIVVNFNNEYIKAFIFKSGTWLEIATNTLIRKIKEIDESKNGLVFLWNDENKSVRNEVDVVAVKDSIPICISCKDSDKYNEVALNELNVYGEKIGGKNAIKILVATKEPIKQTVRTRAKEMVIKLVIFDGDENKFIKTISEIIKVE